MQESLRKKQQLEEEAKREGVLKSLNQIKHQEKEKELQHSKETKDRQFVAFQRKNERERRQQAKLIKINRYNKCSYFL